MQYSDIPGFIVLPFADSGGKTTIPVTTATPGRASLTDGFPALTRTPIASGGIPPDGTDMNGILFEVSGMARWSAAGGPVTYDSAFSTAVGGYPRGSVLTNTAYNNRWFCTLNNNTSDPDAGGSFWMNTMLAKTSITATGSLTIQQLGLVLVDATAGNITLTLPGAGAAIGIPLSYQIVRTDTTANTVTISRAGSNTIEGVVSIPLAVGSRISIMSDGVSIWRVLSMTAGQGMQVFSGAGTFTVPSGVFRIFCRAWGAGGGGGGANNGAAAGGAGGGYSEGWFAVTPGQSIAVTIGAGGSAGTGAPTNGGNGGTTSIGSLLSATGGLGGSGASGGGSAVVNTGYGTGTGGQLNLNGNPANSGLDVGGTLLGSAGGGTFGVSMVGAYTASTGNTSAFPGGGGGGAGGAVASAGSVGAAGLVLIYW